MKDVAARSRLALTLPVPVAIRRIESGQNLPDID
jgi:hypothetical protein